MTRVRINGDRLWASSVRKEIGAHDEATGLLGVLRLAGQP
jgi:hypothetical protein